MKECLVLDHKYYNFFNPVQKIPPRVSKRTYRNGAPLLDKRSSTLSAFL
jgi:hypothetical protein